MKSKTKEICISGVFAALIFVATFFVKVPVASGYVHFGDTLIYLCAMIIGGPFSVAAAVIGAGLADIIGGYAIYAPATVIIKALIALVFVLFGKKEKLFSLRTVILSVVAGLITVGGYFIADMIIAKAYAFVDIPGNIIQAVGSAVLYIVAAVAFDKLDVVKKIGVR